MRLISPKAALLSLGIFTKSESIHDQLKGDDAEEDEKWARLKKMYKRDEYGLYGPQISLIGEGSMFALLMGFLTGGVADSKEVYFKFIEENRVTAFKHHLEAKRALQDAITVSFCKGGWRAGWRLSLVTTSILTIITSINTYNGYSSIAEFIVAGATTCGLYKIKQGPKPMIAGTLVGASLGAMAGGCVVGLMKLTGLSFEDIYNLNHDTIESKRKSNEENLNNLRKRLLDQNLSFRTGTDLVEDEESKEGREEIQAEIDPKQNSSIQTPETPKSSEAPENNK